MTASDSTIIYWDTTDPNNIGWAWRTRCVDGSEESGPVDEDAIVRALDAITAGEAPSASDRDALQDEYPTAILVDQNGADVGALFPS